jgi:hypothetical protein
VQSPNGVVIENWRRVPPSSVKVWISSIAVPPRASSRRNARSASSTSKIKVPTPSGCFLRKRQARPPSPTGCEQTMLMLPAENATDFWWPTRSSSGVERQVSEKSIRSQ